MPQTNNVCIFQEIETDCILVDVTERQIPRSIDNDIQKASYSGKKNYIQKKTTYN